MFSAIVSSLLLLILQWLLLLLLPLLLLLLLLLFKPEVEGPVGHCSENKGLINTIKKGTTTENQGAGAWYMG